MAVQPGSPKFLSFFIFDPYHPSSSATAWLSKVLKVAFSLLLEHLTEKSTCFLSEKNLNLYCTCRFFPITVQSCSFLLTTIVSLMALGV